MNLLHTSPESYPLCIDRPTPLALVIIAAATYSEGLAQLGDAITPSQLVDQRD